MSRRLSEANLRAFQTSSSIPGDDDVYTVGSSVRSIGRQARPTTAGSAASFVPSIAGSLGPRIAASKVANQQRAATTRSRGVEVAAAMALNSHRDEADILEAEFRERLSTAGSSRQVSAQKPATAEPQLLPPVINYVDLLPEEIIEGFRAEYRAMKAEERDGADNDCARLPKPIEPLQSRAHTNAPLASPFGLSDMSAFETRKGKRRINSRAAMSTMSSIPRE